MINHSIASYSFTYWTLTEPFIKESLVLTTLEKKPFENNVGKEKMLVTSVFSLSNFATLSGTISAI